MGGGVEVYEKKPPREEAVMLREVLPDHLWVLELVEEWWIESWFGKLSTTEQRNLHERSHRPWTVFLGTRYN
jgi:hypothetical protein